MLYIGTYVLVGITLIGFTIFVVGVGNGNFIFIGIGLLILFPFILWYLIYLLKKRKRDKEKRLEKENLIQTGHKILIDLDTIVIKTNNWEQEVTKWGRYPRTKHVNIDYNYIILNIPYRNQKIEYRLHINMDPTKLKMLFAIQKETFLYVDPKNTNNTYLDLDFLK